jgi:hypothetical protein
VLFIYRDAARLIGPSNYCGKSATAAGHGHSRRSKKHFFWHAPFSCRQPWCDSDLIALGWTMLGLERSFGTRIVTCADDLVILCRRGEAEEVLSHLREFHRSPSAEVNLNREPIRQQGAPRPSDSVKLSGDPQITAVGWKECSLSHTVSKIS